MNYSDDEDEEISYNDYYNMGYYNGEDCDIEHLDMRKLDPEYFTYECLTVEEVERLLNESVELLSTSLQVNIFFILRRNKSLFLSSYQSFELFPVYKYHYAVAFFMSDRKPDFFKFMFLII